jgi:hypothetical protein
MKTIITLSSSDSQDAQSVLNQCLHHDLFTLLLILGSNPAADHALNYIRNNMIDHDDYKSVEFVHVPVIDYVMEILRSLEIAVPPSNTFSWENLQNYPCITISPERNIIADAVKYQDLISVPGKMNTAILRAFNKQ